jgi:hypothetical protein
MKPFFATPAFGNRVTGQYHMSMVKLYLALQKAGIEWVTPYQRGTMGDAHIERVRNDMFGLFMATDCTHFFQIDADIGFDDPQDVMNQLACGLDFTVGPYLKKKDPPEWTFIPIKGAELRVFDNRVRFIEVQAGATGFMCITRACAERIVKGKMKYKGGSPEFPIDCWDVFQRMVLGFMIGEDVALCLRERERGERVWLNVDAKLVHVGDKEYKGELRIEAAPKVEVQTPIIDWPALAERNGQS